MDTIHYEGARYYIVYGDTAGCEGVALKQLQEMIQHKVPYILPAYCAQEDLSRLYGQKLVFLGTLQSNPYLKMLADMGLYIPEERPQGYSLRVCTGPWGEEKIVILQGADAAGVLYAVKEFRHSYRDNLLQYHGYIYNGRYKPFEDPLLDFELRSAPAIEYRGLWTWGHGVYDYRAYLDNMAAWKMNIAIFWNDYAPVNARKIVQYAHERGIKVVWGYTWCWGEQVDPTDPAQLAYWKEQVLTRYAQEYLPAGGDGIYFQTFTETNEKTINGRSISELAVEWVNDIAGELYRRYPDLWIQFGLHATSVGEECIKFSGVDPRINIVWEDAGCFPYAYNVDDTRDFAPMLRYTDTLMGLRGGEERFGAVLKGMTLLNWTAFEHQKGPFVMGEMSREFVAEKTREKEFFWKYVTPYWITQAGKMKEYAALVAEKPIKERLITALVEDGAWESGPYLPGALMAELLWDPQQDTDTLIARIMHCADCKAL